MPVFRGRDFVEGQGEAPADQIDRDQGDSQRVADAIDFTRDLPEKAVVFGVEEEVVVA